jgi:hypothetical protein
MSSKPTFSGPGTLITYVRHDGSVRSSLLFSCKRDTRDHQMMRTNEIERERIRHGVYPETSAVWTEHHDSARVCIWRILWRS